MITFWIAIGIMLATTISAVLWPLVGSYKSTKIDQNELNISIIREQFKQLELDYKSSRIGPDEYQAAQEELELAVINDINPSSKHKKDRVAKNKGTAMLLLLALPVASLFVYNLLGSPGLIATPPRLPPTQADIESMVDGLAARLQSNPDDLEGQAILGKSYMLMGRYADAQTVFAKLLERNPDSVGLLISYADAAAMSANGVFAGAAYDAIKQALKLEPDNIKARWMAGMAENEAGNIKKALSIWNPLLHELQQQNPDMAAELQRMIAALSNSGADATETTSAATNEQNIETPSLRVKVTLAPGIELAPDDTVFVYARAMPLAIKRYSGKDIPTEIVLDDTTAMMPAMRLSLFPIVKIDARVSKTGSATPQSGDHFGRVENISISNSDIIPIVIDQVVE